MRNSFSRTFILATLGISACVTGSESSVDRVETAKAAIIGPADRPLVLASPGDTFNQPGVFIDGISTPQQTVPGTFPLFQGFALGAGDVTGDGVPEVIVAGAGRFQVSDQFGNAPAAMQLAAALAPDGEQFTGGDAIAVGDLNNDGFDEVIWGHRGNAVNSSTLPIGSLQILSANGAPPVAPNFFGPGGNPVFGFSDKLAVCDINHDGFDDVVVAGAGPVLVYTNPALGLAPSSFFSGVLPQNVGPADQIACADLNGDGFDDLIIAHLASQGGGGPSVSYEVFSYKTRPAIDDFFESASFPGGIAPFLDAGGELAAGDLDGDGSAEIIIVTSGGSAQVFSGPGKPAPSALTSAGVPSSTAVLPAGTRVAVPRRSAHPALVGFTVPYIVQTILYQVPGDRSGTTYGAQSTLGTRAQWSITDGTGLFGNVSGTYGGVGFSFGATMSSSQNGSVAVTSQSTNSSTVGMHRSDSFCATTGVTCDPSLDPDHTADLYVILLDVEGQLTTFSDGTPSRYDVDLSTGTIADLNVLQLQALAQTPQDPQNLVTADVKAFIGPADATQLLAMDPYISGEAIDQHPERFVPACESSGSCTTPEQILLDPKPPGAQAGDIVHTAMHAQANGTDLGNTTSTGLDQTIAIGGFGARANIMFQNVTSESDSDQRSATITLETNSSCEKGTVDLWFDTAFGSFLTIPHLFSICQQQPMQTMSFEALADWQVQGGGAATLSNQAVGGAQSFSIAAAGWTPIVMSPLSSALLRGAATSSNLSAVSFAVQIPTSQPNPFFIGGAQMYLTAPSANVHNAYLGQVDLTPLPRGQFVRVGFTIPSFALHALTEDHPDVSFTIVLNVNAGTAGWLLDDLEIGH
jgi:hypothetical protein